MPKQRKPPQKQQHEASGPKLLVCSGDHIIKVWLNMESYCGKRLMGWRYVESHDIATLCDECRERYSE